MFEIGVGENDEGIAPSEFHRGNLAVEPILQKVATMVQSTETIFRVNIGVEQDLASRYAIDGTPTLIMFLNGSEVGRVEGPQPTVEGVMTAVTQPFES